MEPDSHVGAGRPNEIGRRGFRKYILIVAIVLFLLVVWIGFIHDGILRDRAKSGLAFKTSENSAVAFQERTASLPTQARPSVDTNILIESRPLLPEKTDAFYISPVSSDAVFIYGNTGRVAIIDVTRIARALPIATTPEEMTLKIAKIKDAIAAVAAAHNLIFVFDSTAMTRSDSLVFPYSEGTPDITALVLQTINSFSNQIGKSNALASPDQGVNQGRF